MDGKRDAPFQADTATRMGRYRLLERIGQGATAAVFRASDDESGRPVALKLLMTDLEGDDQVRTRFRREVEIARVLRHRNVVAVYDAGEADGRLYLAMELLEGVTLREHMTKQPAAALEDKLDLMIQLCEGLAAAHDRGIYHRDLKPTNLFIRPDGELKILDFGIARWAASSMTVAGLLVGTPDFMSPEQARGGEIDQRSDIFSAGAVFYYLLSGRKPFPGDHLPRVLHKVEHEDPAALEPPEAPSLLARIVSRALAKSPGARHPHVRALLRDLIEFRRDFAADTRRDVTIAREHVARVRALRDRCRPLAAALRIEDAAPSPDDVLVGKGLTARYPWLAERGAAVLAGAPMPRAMAADVADSFAKVATESERLLAVLTEATAALRSAQASTASGNVVQACEHAARALAAAPSSPVARRMLDASRREAMAREGAALRARAQEALMHGRQALAREEWASAEADLVRARELYPDAPGLDAAVQELESTRAAAGAARAEAELRRTAEVEVLVAAAGAALARGALEEAIRTAGAVLSLQPGERRAECIRAEAVAGGRSASEAADVAARVDEHLARARTLVASARFEEARQEAQRALSLDPASATARRLLADVARTLAAARRASEAGRIAARCAKAGRPFVQRAGRALLLGDFERARGAAETALAIDPASDDAKAVLARAQQALVDLGDKGAPASARLLDGRHMRAPAQWTRVRVKWDEIRHSRPLAFRRPVLPASACRLRIARASGATRQLDLAARSYRLGRAPENEIVLEDGSQTVSPFHAELRPGPSGYVLHDCASDHGVWVDGRRVNRVRLEPDVPVAIGPYRLVLEDASDQPPAAAAQA